MAYKRKYRKGGQITSLDELVKQEFVYQGDKIQHIGWVGSWQIHYAARGIRNGWFYYAVKVSDEESEEKEKGNEKQFS